MVTVCRPWAHRARPCPRHLPPGQRCPFFQKYLIPNALTAGFILLPFYNFVAPLLGMTRGLENLVFHLLNLSFIAMSLKEGSMKGSGKRIFATAVSIVSQYTIQIFIGLGITALFIATLMPKLFINFGFFLALGYGLGPGQSFADRQVVGIGGLRERGQPGPHLRGHGLHLGLHRRHLPHQLRQAQGLDRRDRSAITRSHAHRHLRQEREAPSARCGPTPRRSTPSRTIS